MAKKISNKKSPTKKPRVKKEKKDLDVFVDGKERDLTIKRKDGETEIDFDGKNLDFTITKDEDGTKVKVKTDGKLRDAIQSITRIIKGKRG